MNKKILSVLIIIGLLTGLYLHQKRSGPPVCKDCNVILLVVDALRADHVSCYGYPRNTTPNLCRLSEKGVLFRDAVAPGTGTVRTIPPIFTSLHSDIAYINIYRRDGKYQLDKFPDFHLTLAEILDKNGYKTAGFQRNDFMDKKYNIDQGFDFYNQKCFKIRDNRGAGCLNNQLVSWLENESRKKFFIYMHYMDPHQPYRPPKGYSENFSKEKNNSSFIDRYDGCIRYWDDELGKLIDSLKKQGVFEDTIIIVTADHGEVLKDRRGYIGHGGPPYRETINVPLIMTGKRIPDKKINALVNTMDIYPTILDYLGLETPNHIQGKSLIPLINGEKNKLRDFTYINSPMGQGVITEKYKLIITHTNKTLLYNREKDPLEKTIP